MINERVYTTEEFGTLMSSYGRIEDQAHVQGASLVIESGTKSLPKVLKVTNTNNTELGTCVKISRCYVGLPSESFEVEGKLVLEKWHSAALPKKLKARELVFNKCQGVEALPKELEFNSLLVDNCDKLKLPASSPGNLILHKYKHRLQNGMVINGDLSFISCKRLEHLAENMDIKGNLIIVDCNNLKSWPHKITIGGQVKGDNLQAIQRLQNAARVEKLVRSLVLN